MSAASRLFTPTRLGALKLRNRIVMAPMTRDRAGLDDRPTALMAEYYRQRASAGLIVSEGTQPCPAGKGYWRTPGIHSDAQIEGWREVGRGVHDAGGSMVLQLMHVGRASVRANKHPAADTVAPSAIASRDPIPGPDGIAVAPEVPRALALGEIPGVIADYAQAARNARAAGLDGVELHCTSGYLPMQILSANANRRTDRYGGSAVNRARFVVETLEALAGAIGADRVGFRVFPGNPFNDMVDDDPPATYAALLDAVDGLGLAYCHLIHFPTPALDGLALIRRHWRGPIIANNNLDRVRAEALLADGIDAVSFGRPFIANPDLVERLRQDAPLARPDRTTFYTGEECGYTNYPPRDAGLQRERSEP
jgi:N-ethylmaleimide reductase